MQLASPLVDRTRWSAVGRCPIEKAMTLIGSRPAMLLMREAHYGTRRFDDFVERVGLAPATASTHLRALTEAGLLERRRYQEPGERARDGYVLTEAGRDLVPVLVGLFAWGVRHTDGSDELEFAHAGCDRPLALHVQCTAGHEVEPEEIEVRPVRQRRRGAADRGGAARM